MNRILKYFAFAIFYLTPVISFARGDGGGSSSGGGGGGSSSGGSGMSVSFGDGGSSGGNSCTSIWCISFTAIFLIFSAFILIRHLIKTNKEKMAREKKMEETINKAASNDSAWDKEKLKQTAISIFYSFQEAWGSINIEQLSKILEPEMHKKVALKLSVLNNEGRRNITKITNLIDVSFVSINDNVDNNKDSFSISFTATADDKLIDIKTNETLFSDNSSFTEIWNFVRSDNNWLLKSIKQATESAEVLIPEISEFAKKNNFYYSPDFGWLMLPNKGVLFKESRFGSTDINNHVVGYFRNKIVEFYTMTVWKNDYDGTDYLIAQAILPIEYNDILIRRKHLLQFAPKGLREHKLESNDFIKEFDVYSDERDNISTFELLSPNFMENIMRLPFELTIEVVGNTLYLCTKDTKADYNKMLEILSNAFDEMKM